MNNEPFSTRLLIFGIAFLLLIYNNRNAILTWINLIFDSRYHKQPTEHSSTTATTGPRSSSSDGGHNQINHLSEHSSTTATSGPRSSSSNSSSSSSSDGGHNQLNHLTEHSSTTATTGPRSNSSSSSDGGHNQLNHLTEHSSTTATSGTSSSVMKHHDSALNSNKKIYEPNSVLASIPNTCKGMNEYGDLALSACNQVYTEMNNGGKCGTSCLASPDEKNALDIARIWTYGTKGMKKEQHQPVDGGIDSCVGAVAVALGECQHSAVSSDYITKSPFNQTACSNSGSIQATAGGLWQQSGPLTSDNWEKAGSTIVDGITYKCNNYNISNKDGFGPETDVNMATGPRSTVCQARLAFSKVITPGGCGVVDGAQNIPLCSKTPYNVTYGKQYIDLDKDYKGELIQKGLPCWADALCVTGIRGSGQWPGPSEANGQTNSFGHYYKSCAGNTSDNVWNPFDGNLGFKAGTINKWTPTTSGQCAPSCLS